MNGSRKPLSSTRTKAERDARHERDEGRENRRGEVIDLIIAANGRCIWEADDSVGWEDGNPRQTMRGYAVGGQLLVMIEASGGIDVLRSISPTNSLDDLGEAIARISRGEAEPQAIDQAQLDGALKVLEDGAKVSELIAAASSILADVRFWPRKHGSDLAAGLTWYDHLEPLRKAAEAFDIAAAAAAADPGEVADDD